VAGWVVGGAGQSLAREWVAVDGRKLQADFLSATDAEVKVKRTSDGRELTIRLEQLSDADRKWVAENKGKAGEQPAAARPRLGLDPAPGEAENPYGKLLTGKWELAEFRELPYAIFGGADLDPSAKYPLILGLHGKSDNNENGEQKGILSSFTQEKLYAEHPAILVAPLCFQPYGGTGGGWSKEPGDLAVRLVKDMVKKLPMVDADRVYVLGHSMGGGGTLSLLTQEPRLFAAGIVIAGWADAGAAKVLKKVPVWAFHGSDDDVVEPGSIQKLAKSLERSKLFKYTEYPGEGHGITGKVFADPQVYEWLFAQKS